MTMAWKSYRDGEVTVGAAITDAWEPYSAVAVTSASPRWHRGGLLARAEMEALAAVPDDKHSADNDRSECIVGRKPRAVAALMAAT